MEIPQVVEQYPDEYELVFRIVQEWDDRGSHTNEEELGQLNETMIRRCATALPELKEDTLYNLISGTVLIYMLYKANTKAAAHS